MGNCRNRCIWHYSAQLVSSNTQPITTLPFLLHCLHSLSNLFICYMVSVYVELMLHCLVNCIIYKCTMWSIMQGIEDLMCSLLWQVYRYPAFGWMVCWCLIHSFSLLKRKVSLSFLPSVSMTCKIMSELEGLGKSCFNIFYKLYLIMSQDGIFRSKFLDLLVEIAVGLNNFTGPHARS